MPTFNFPTSGGVDAYRQYLEGVAQLPGQVTRTPGGSLTFQYETPPPDFQFPDRSSPAYGEFFNFFTRDDPSRGIDLVDVPLSQLAARSGLSSAQVPIALQETAQDEATRAMQQRLRQTAAAVGLAFGGAALAGGGAIGGGAAGSTAGGNALTTVSLPSGVGTIAAPSAGGAAAGGAALGGSAAVPASAGGAAAAGGAGMANGFWGQLGGSLISGVLGTRAAGQAADAQTEANQAAIAEQRRQFNTILDLTQPGREVGNQSLNAIAGLVGLPGIEGMEGDFDPEALMNAPGTQTVLDDTIRRIRQSGAARGSAGGNVLTELGDRISGFQSDRLFNSLFQLAGFGPGATSTAAGAAGSAGANIGNLLQSSGVANASGILGAGQSQNAALQNVLQFMTLQNMLGGPGGGGLYNSPGPNGLSTINTNAINSLRI